MCTCNLLFGQPSGSMPISDRQSEINWSEIQNVEADSSSLGRVWRRLYRGGWCMDFDRAAGDCRVLLWLLAAPSRLLEVRLNRVGTLLLLSGSGTSRSPPIRGRYRPHSARNHGPDGRTGVKLMMSEFALLQISIELL